MMARFSLVCTLLWSMNGCAVAAEQILVISEAETTTGWRGVTLTGDAATGQHAVRYQVPAGSVGGCYVTHEHLGYDFNRGGELRFWLRLTGTGTTTLHLKLNAWPFADGHQATWQIDQPLPADGRWRQYAVDLSSPYMRWGNAGDRSQALHFRTQGSPDSALLLDLDQVEIVPLLLAVATSGGQWADDQFVARLSLTSKVDTNQRVRIGGGVTDQRVELPAGGRVTVEVPLRVDPDWLRAAQPLEATEHWLTAMVEGADFTRREIAVSVVKPLELPERPRLLATAAEIAALPERAARFPWAKAELDALMGRANAWANRAVELPDRGSQWWHWYSCKKDGANLRTESPTAHVCPVCQTVYTGWPYDDVVLARQHSALSSAVRELGLAWRLSGEEKYLAKAREILLAYAARYRDYPLHNIHGDEAVGGGRVGPQTLDESTWLIPMAQGADLIWEALTPAEQAAAADGLFLPASEVIRAQKMGIHNIQCWKNSAVGLVGLLLGDADLIADAVTSNHGFQRQIAEGITPEGQWYEGAWGYHWYTVSALWALAEAGQRCGLGLYDYVADGRSYKSLFDGPLVLAMPDGRLPAFNDSGTASIFSGSRQYECAYAHYRDPAYLTVLQRSSRRTLEALLVGVGDLPPAPAEATASRNFPGAGYAVLRQERGDARAWLCLKYGPHGGGHGHHDKLNFVFWANGLILGVDPGTAHYGVPIQKEWFRATVAHNTLTVDEQNQRESTGQSLAFGEVDGIALAAAEAGPIYPDLSYRRAVALFDAKLVVICDQVTSTKGERVMDLAYHQAGVWTSAPSGASVTPGEQPGYMHFHDVVSATGPLPLITASEKDLPDVTVGIAVAALEPGETWAGNGIGRNTNERVPLVLRRTRGTSATVGWAIATDGNRPDVTVSGTAAAPTVTVTLGGQQYTLSLTAGDQPQVTASSGQGQLVAP